MPRKPKFETTKITVVVDGTPITVTLFPPNGRQSNWYVYWQGLPNSRSTGATNLQDAIGVAEKMVRNGGKRPTPVDGVMSDEEFYEIQKAHFTRDKTPDVLKRAAKSLEVCREAMDAFRRITGLTSISLATPDDCARFQRLALELPKSWRLPYPKARRTDVPNLKPNTVLKWSRSLAAAFQRASVNAGKRGIRGVVSEAKLLKMNPWQQFQWIEGTEKDKRQFSEEELLSILDYFEAKWAGVTAATAAVKTCIWAWARLSEMTSLKWDDLRVCGQEQHFQIIGKWGVEKWARLPNGLMDQLKSIQVGNDFVFAAYADQIRAFYSESGRIRFAQLVSDTFSPRAFGDWFQERIQDWANQTGHPPASPHAFRKTALQAARCGEDLIQMLAQNAAMPNTVQNTASRNAHSGEGINRQIAQDARLSESVMMAHYIKEGDKEMRQASNRTYHRILLGLSLEIATRYGYKPDDEVAELEKRHAAASAAKDWEAAGKLALELARRNCQPPSA